VSNPWQCFWEDIAVKCWHLSLLALVAASLAAARADEPKDTTAELPKAPDGWKYVASKDGTYQFLFPNESKGSGSREQTFRRSGLVGRVQSNYCVTKDDLALAIAATNLSGPALKGLKIGDVYDLMIGADKDAAKDVTDPKEVAVGQLKGREFYMTKGSMVFRKVLLVVKGRVYELTAGAPDKDKTTTDAADTFLKSLVVTPKAPPSKDPAPSKPEPPKTDSKPPLP
jgi:hypothetical protein